MPDPRPSVDFDHHSPDYARDFRAVYKDMRSKCPVAWSSSHGGYWVVTRYDDVAEVARDDYTFSSRHDLPNGRSFTGIGIPPSPFRSTPIEMDPPRFQAYRQILTKWFSPAYAEKLKPLILRSVTECLDARIRTGTIDFILHLANPIPGIVTMVFLGLPGEDWEQFAPHYHNNVAYPPGTPEHDEAERGCYRCLERMQVEITERRRRPREDLLTHLTRVEVEGSRLADETILDVCSLILGGGLDTTTGLMGHGLDYLGRHPQLRARLLADPKLIMMNFCEELLRFNTPTQALARTATRDVEVGGQKIKAGDRLLICWASANHDESKFDRPEEFNIDRFPNLHQAFGLGGHRCLGSTFARYEFSIAIEQVLRRMPDYRLADGAEHYRSIGIVNGWHRLPASFTPGEPVGSAATSSYL
ncbi:MAG: cytochrome P450 [Gammaproteobacteria bacterium]